MVVVLGVVGIHYSSRSTASPSKTYSQFLCTRLTNTDMVDLGMVKDEKRVLDTIPRMRFQSRERQASYISLCIYLCYGHLRTKLLVLLLVVLVADFLSRALEEFTTHAGRIPVSPSALSCAPAKKEHPNKGRRALYCVGIGAGCPTRLSSYGVSLAS